MPKIVDGMKPNGTAVSELRRLSRRSLTDLATDAGMSFGYLGEIERGTKEVVSRDKLLALAAALDVDVRALTTEPHLFEPVPAVA